MELLGRTRGTQTKTVCRVKRKRKPTHPEDIDHSILGFRNPSAGWKTAEIYSGRSSTSRSGITQMLEGLFPKKYDFFTDTPKDGENEIEVTDMELDEIFSFLPKKKAVDDPFEQTLYYSSLCIAKMFNEVELNARHPAIVDMMQVIFKRGGEDAIELYLESEENITRLRSLGA
jgi:hypothetical protein